MLRLRDIMTTEVLTVTPETSLRSAMELFSTHHVSGAPVVAGSRVVGVVSANDVIAFATTAPGREDDREVTVREDGLVEPNEWGEELVAPGRLAGLWEALDGEDVDLEPAEPPARDPLDDATVADAMTWGIYALPPDTGVIPAAEQMRAADVHRLLVMEEGELLGIVTTMDIVRAVAESRLVRRTYVFDRGRGVGPGYAPGG